MQAGKNAVVQVFARGSEKFGQSFAQSPFLPFPISRGVSSTCGAIVRKYLSTRPKSQNPFYVAVCRNRGALAQPLHKGFSPFGLRRTAGVQVHTGKHGRHGRATARKRLARRPP